jgi:hypothetical protein
VIGGEGFQSSVAVEKVINKIILGRKRRRGVVLKTEGRTRTRGGGGMNGME